MSFREGQTTASTHSRGSRRHRREGTDFRNELTRLWRYKFAVRTQRKVSKASSENAKLTIIAETGGWAKKNLPRAGAEKKGAKMAAVES
jgi:hypothetical protein